MFRQISKNLEPKQDEDNNQHLPLKRACRPPPIASLQTIGSSQSTRTPAASHAMEQSYKTLATVPFKSFDATRADTILLLSRFIPTSGIFRPPNEKAYHAPQSAPTTAVLTPSGSYSSISQGPSKGSASLGFLEKEQRLYSEKNLDSVTKSDHNMQPKSPVPKTSSIGSESMGSQNEDHDAKTEPRPLKIVLKMQNYRLTKKQKCDPIVGNGQEAQMETDLENSHANSTNLLNQNLVTGTNASATNPQLQKLENERRRERKRQQNRDDLFKWGKIIRREEETNEELCNRVDNLRSDISELRKELVCISKKKEEVKKENQSLMEELVEKYGEESIADLISENPATP